MPHVIWKLAPYIWILCCTFGKWKVCSSIKFTDFMPTCGKKCWQESLWVLATDLALHHRLSHYIYCACCKRKMSAWTLLYISLLKILIKESLGTLQPSLLLHIYHVSLLQCLSYSFTLTLHSKQISRFLVDYYHRTSVLAKYGRSVGTPKGKPNCQGTSIF